MRSVIAKLSELMGVKQLYAGVITVSIEVNLNISTRMFHKLVIRIHELGFKLERVSLVNNEYFEAVHRKYDTGESIILHYLPINGFIIYSVIYRKQGETIK
jgi:hypothetical protein